MTKWKKTFVCSFVAQILSIFGFSFALPFLPFFIEELGVTDPARQAWWAGVILGANGLTLALFAPIWGVIADRYGRKAMVMRSMLGGALVMVLMSYSRNITELLVCRLLQGALTGTVSASIALVASVTPSNRSGFALGMMQSAVFIGVATGPLIGGLIADEFGYRAAFRIGAVMILLGGLLVQYGTSESFSPVEPNEKGASLFAGLFTNRGFMFAVFILFGLRFANTIVNPSFPLIIKDILDSKEHLNSITGLVMTFSGLAGAIVSGTLGYFGDKVGHNRIVIICTLGAAISAAAHAIAQSILDLTIYHLLFGMTISGILPAVNSMICQKTDSRNIGKAFGVATSLSMIGMAIGPVVGGFLAAEYGIRVPFLAAGVCQAGMAVILILTLLKQKR